MANIPSGAFSDVLHPNKPSNYPLLMLDGYLFFCALGYVMSGGVMSEGN